MGSWLSVLANFSFSYNTIFVSSVSSPVNSSFGELSCVRARDHCCVLCDVTWDLLLTWDSPWFRIEVRFLFWSFLTVYWLVYTYNVDIYESHTFRYAFKMNFIFLANGVQMKIAGIGNGISKGPFAVKRRTTIPERSIACKFSRFFRVFWRRRSDTKVVSRKFPAFCGVPIINSQSGCRV